MSSIVVVIGMIVVIVCCCWVFWFISCVLSWVYIFSLCLFWWFGLVMLFSPFLFILGLVWFVVWGGFVSGGWLFVYVVSHPSFVLSFAIWSMCSSPCWVAMPFPSFPSMNAWFLGSFEYESRSVVSCFSTIVFMFVCLVIMCDMCMSSPACFEYVVFGSSL